MFSTCVVSWTPSAAVGSSMMMSFETKLADRLIATHCRWPPDMLPIAFFKSGILMPVFSRTSIDFRNIRFSFRMLNGPRLKYLSSLPR